MPINITIPVLSYIPVRGGARGALPLPAHCQSVHPWLCMCLFTNTYALTSSSCLSHQHDFLARFSRPLLISTIQPSPPPPIGLSLPRRQLWPLKLFEPELANCPYVTWIRLSGQLRIRESSALLVGTWRVKGFILHPCFELPLGVLQKMLRKLVNFTEIVMHI
uniref:HDC09225 n=1 Tax=Drosophila melanogaster TaxID=7227 RepID=Q6ILK3_DROME|nr:TPA_inf: HDC09225 [Drosophila melanogaster]